MKHARQLLAHVRLWPREIRDAASGVLTILRFDSPRFAVLLYASLGLLWSLSLYVTPEQDLYTLYRAYSLIPVGFSSLYIATCCLLMFFGIGSGRPSVWRYGVLGAFFGQLYAFVMLVVWPAATLDAWLPSAAAVYGGGTIASWWLLVRAPESPRKRSLQSLLLTTLVPLFAVVLYLDAQINLPDGEYVPWAVLSVVGGWILKMFSDRMRSKTDISTATTQQVQHVFGGFESLSDRLEKERDGWEVRFRDVASRLATVEMDLRNRDSFCSRRCDLYEELPPITPIVLPPGSPPPTDASSVS
jgi:hypothetical protein